MIEKSFGSLFEVPSRNGIYKAKEFHGEGVPIINMGELFALERIGSQEMKRLQVNPKELSSFGVLEGDLLLGWPQRLDGFE